MAEPLRLDRAFLSDPEKVRKTIRGLERENAELRSEIMDLQAALEIYREAARLRAEKGMGKDGPEKEGTHLGSTAPLQS